MPRKKHEYRHQYRQEGRNEPSDKRRWKSVAKNGGATTNRLDDDQALLIKEAIHQGMSVNQAAKHYGVTYATARRIHLGLRKQGESGGPTKTHSPRLTDDERSAIRAAYRTGATIEQLAQQWSRGETTIRRVIRADE